MSKQRIVIVHGSALTPGIINRYWYKWLQNQLQSLGFDAIAPAFPDEHYAKDSIWIPFLKDHLQIQQVMFKSLWIFFDHFFSG